MTTDGTRNARGAERLADAVRRALAAESALTQAQAENERLREGLVACANELNRYGWGDMHYGDQPQERRVVEAVAAAWALASVPDTTEEDA